MLKTSEFEHDLKPVSPPPPFFLLLSYTDSDMQGTEGALGGPDVRRRIPIKLLPKQARSKGFHISLTDTDY